jgi:hypothetical protein
MARATKRRKPSALLDQGVGLLEVMLPHGTPDEENSDLPPGQRDPGGFWYPAGYSQPGDIFTPAQRKLQAKQRQVQRRRLEGGPIPPAPVPGSSGTMRVHATLSLPNAASGYLSRGSLPALGTAHAALYDPVTDSPLPLPAPSPEAQIPAPRCDTQVTRVAGTALADPSQARVLAAGALVDSRKASD